jgi:hypothetical protein
MEWDQFWRIIGAAYRADPFDHFEAVNAELDQLPWFGVVAFQARLDEAVAAADRPDLWGAATLIQGGCSDDAFVDFRAWLVGRGQEVYDAALLDPDSLADVLDGDPVDGFGLDAAAVRVYEAKTGMSDFYQQVRQLRAAVPPGPTGDDSDLDDEGALRRRFPRLAALYPPPAPPEEDAD